MINLDNAPFFLLCSTFLCKLHSQCFYWVFLVLVDSKIVALLCMNTFHQFSLNRPTELTRSSSRNVCIYVYMSPSHAIFFKACHWPSDHMISSRPFIGKPSFPTLLSPPIPLPPQKIFVICHILCVTPHAPGVTCYMSPDHHFMQLQLFSKSQDVK